MDNNEREPLIEANNGRIALSPSQARKRPRNPDNWAKKVAKRQRNSGLEYTSVVTKQVVAAKKIGPDCKCKRKCFEKVGNVNIEVIFKDFYASACWDIQTAYIQNQTIVNDVARHRTENNENQKSCSRKYFVKLPGVLTQVQICKKAFASIHGISTARIDRAQTSKTASNVPIKDRRGKYGNHNQVSIARKEKVKKHIDSFPKMTSHYSRKTSSNALYLNNEVQTESQMYDLYKEWLEEKLPRRR